MMKSKAVLSFLLCIALFAGTLVLPAGAAESTVTSTFENLGGTKGASDATQLNLRRACLYFNANGGTGSMAALVADFEGWVTVPACTFTRSGYTFAGWNTASDGSGTSLDPGTFIISLTTDWTLYAQWIKNQSTITFDTAGGSAVAPITQDEGTPVTAPSNPVKAGFDFMGWIPAIPAIMPVDDITCEAQWEIPFDPPGGCDTIHFDLGGGSWGYDPYIIYDEGTAITAPSDPTKEGYTFCGWVPAIPTYCPVDDITCVAQWEPIVVPQSTITFDTWGGSLVEPITQDEGTAVTPPAEPVKAGFNFMGWTPAVPAIMPEDDITCVAQWQPIIQEPVITLDPNGGKWDDGSTAPRMFYYVDGILVPWYGWGWTIDAGDEGTPVMPPEDPTREGFTFSGWMPAIPAIIMGNDTTCYAQWEPITYTSTIIFDSDGGSAVAPITQDEGTAVTPPADPVKAGYIFAGWSPAIPAIMPEDDITCVAQWTGNTYTVTFDKGWGLVTPTDKTVIYGSAYGDLPVPTSAVDDFVFAGWWTEFGTEVTDTSIVSIAGNHTLHSKWDIACHTLTLKLNDGTDNDYLSESVDYKVIVTFNYFWTSPANPNPEIPDPNLYYRTYDYEYYNPGGFAFCFSVGSIPPIRTGYDFVGWSESPVGSSVSHSITMGNTDITLYAVWVLNQNTAIITFDSNGGTAVTQIALLKGATVTAPVPPVKVGYIFTGWSPAVPAIMPADDITCVAQWRLFGDIDNNGSITSIDALMALQGSTGEYVLSALQLLAADANHDGRISPIDALMLLHAASGSITL